MAKAEATVEELVGMIERGELRLPEMQRRYVWRSTRVRDLLDSLYRGGVCPKSVREWCTPSVEIRFGAVGATRGTRDY